MIFIDKMKNFKIYKTPTFLPTVPGNKKFGSAILMMTPNYQSSKKIMENKMLVNKKRYESYYIERDISYYINSKKIEEVDENSIIANNAELELVTETKRSNLDDSQFGVPEQRKFPLDTEAHVRSAVKFFNYVEPQYEEKLAKRIIAALKKFNITDIKVSEKNRFSKYYHPTVNESVEVLSENLFKNVKDITYNRNKFEEGLINLCFVTGLSGSGKSTMINNMKKNEKSKKGIYINTDYIHLDDIIYIKDRFTDKQLKDYSDMLYSFFTDEGIKYYIGQEDSEVFEEKNGRYIENLFKDFIHFAMRYSNYHVDKKYVLEGVYFYIENWFKPEEFKNYAFYIKGTSAITSMIRSAKRDNTNKTDSLWKNATNIDRIKWYFTNENQLIKFRNYFISLGAEQVKNESAKIPMNMGDKLLFFDESTDISESYIINESDIYYNQDKFNSGLINLCFITGLSGSGKSTMAKGITKESVCLDDIITSQRFSDAELKEYGNAIYKFFTTVGKKYRIPYKGEFNTFVDNYGESYFEDCINDFTNFIIDYAKSHKKDKFVVEGVQLFCFVKPELLKDHAVYIKGTSAIISWARALVRDVKDGKTVSEKFNWFVSKLLDFPDYFTTYESLLNKYRHYFGALEAKHEAANIMDTTDFIRKVNLESGLNPLNMGDKLLFFDESAVGDAQIRRLLFNSRLKKRKDLLLLYDQVQHDEPWIKYAYPDINRYRNRNLFVDLYFYTSIFFENNNWAFKKGLTLFQEFVQRLLSHPVLNNYNYKTIIIPITDWDFTHNGNVWNFRDSINIISLIYQLMFTNQLALLQRIFGNHNILFIADDKYFKVNFSEITSKDLKKFTAKFKLFTIKICRNEEFDYEDIDTSADHVESPEIIQAKIADRIEDVKGVDITPQLAIANQKKKEAGKSITSAIASSNSTPQDKETIKKIEKNKEIIAKAKPVTKVSYATQNASEEDSEDEKKNDEKVARLADEIVAASDAGDEDEALDNLNTDEIKKTLIELQADDDKVNISAGRAARMNELSQKADQQMVNGKTVKEILSDNSNKEAEVTNVDVASPNNEWNNLTFLNFDKHYNIEKDIIATFKKFETCYRPIVIRNIEVTDNSTSEDRVALYNVDMEDYRGRRYNIKLDIPIMEDNRFMLRGNNKSIQTQFANMPIIKTDVNTCQLISNYSKIFLYYFGSSAGKSLPQVSRFLRALGKYNGRKIKTSNGQNKKVSVKYHLPNDYVDIGSVYSIIETDTHKFYFNQDQIRKEYTIEPGKGIPCVYNKKTNSIEYFTDDNNYHSFIEWMYNIIIGDEPRFADIFNSISAARTSAYTRASIMSTKIPLIVICAYHVGLSETLRRANIKYQVVEKLSQEIRRDFNLDWVEFDDGYIVYEVTYASSLLMNGLKACSTSLFSIGDIDNKDMYLEFLDNFGGRFKADGLDNFRDLFVDPMTKETLEFYHMPTDYIDILLYGNSLMGDNKYIKHTDTSSRRLKRYQLIAVYTYKVLATAYAKYSIQLKHSRNSAEFSVKQSAVIEAFLTDSITSDDSCINALRDVETTNSITTKGPSGMNSDRAYSIDKRTYTDSMVNVLAMSTGFAGNVGVTRQATINANVTADGYVKQNDGDTSKMNDANTLSATEALIPFGSTHDDPMRTAMSFVQTSKHMVRTEESDPLLVTNGADEVMPYLTTNKFAYKMDEDGKILEIDDTHILVQYKSGKKVWINLQETTEKNSDGGYYVPLKLDAAKGLKVGSMVKKNQIVAYDKYSFSSNLGESNNLAYNIGKLAKVAVINTDEGFEDSGIISDKMANKLATRIQLKYDVILNKNTNVIYMAKIGQHIEATDNILVWDDPSDDEDSAEVLKMLQSADVSELGKRKITSKVTGTLKSMKIYRTVEIDQLSDSLKKIVNDYEAPLIAQEKKMKAEGLSTSTIPAHYVLAPTGKLKKAQESVMIEFYVEYLDTVGVGDKVVYNSANKAVEKGIFPIGAEPYTAFRPNEKIDAFVSETSIDKRMVTSTIVYGSLQKLMIELDRSVKDIMGIQYNDSDV